MANSADALLFIEHMDQKELREFEAKCIQEEPPACKAGCPIGVDGRGFSMAMARGKLDEGRAILDKSMPLTAILARLCEAPCEQYCIRKDLGGAINIGALEQYCVTSTRTRSKILKLPGRSKKVAVIGGAPSGLTAAFDLAKKGYPVTLYHREEELGGWLCRVAEERLPVEARVEEISRLSGIGVVFEPVSALDGALLESLSTDAVYVAQDDRIEKDLSLQMADIDLQTFALAKPGMFTGGVCSSNHLFRLITDIFQGREAALSIDRYLQGASLTASRMKPRQGQTELFTQTKDIDHISRIVPSDPKGYDMDEATAEAARCIDCQCLECVRHCVYLAEFKGYPKMYARRVYNNSAIVKGVHQANTFINSCSLCGQCEVLCPKDFSMAELCLQARQQMVEEKRMPPSAHWFALEEMHAAQHESCLVQHNIGTDQSKWLFFPGCQLSGIRHLQTIRLYDHLLEIEPQTGIWLDCCGAPAHWSGRRDEFTLVIRRLEESWLAMGRPRVLAGCSTCLKMLRDNLPQCKAESVWTVLAEYDIGISAERPALALSDPCTTRHDSTTRDAVRALLHKIGQPLAPLEMSGELTECCGFGGLMENGNPGVARKVVEARAAQSEADMLTYCAMCRDRLARTGKPVLHLLDLLFPETALSAAEPPASLSARRVNRRRLKKTLLARLGETEKQPRFPWEDLQLLVDEEMALLLERRRILEDDIRQVLFQADRERRYFEHAEDTVRIACSRLGQVTFWVKYRKEEEYYHLLACWSHRMTITT